MVTKKNNTQGESSPTMYRVALALWMEQIDINMRLVKFMQSHSNVACPQEYGGQYFFSLT